MFYKANFLHIFKYLLYLWGNFPIGVMVSEDNCHVSCIGPSGH